MPESEFVPVHCGYMIRERDNALIYRPSGSGDYLFLCFPEGIRMTLKGEERLLGKHACIIYAPGDYQRFRGCPGFLNTYVHFRGPEPELTRLGIPFSTPFYPSDYALLGQQVLEIQREQAAADSCAQPLARLALQKLLLLISRHFSAYSNLTTEAQQKRQRLEQLRLEMLTNCAYPWTVGELAFRAAMSRSSFYSCYREFFGAAPKAELLDARMAKARLLLTNQALTVEEAARESGFESLEHFTRYYKKYYGQTPRRRKLR